MSRKTPVPVNPTPPDTRRSPPARPPLPRPASTPGGESPRPPGDPAGRETRRPSAPPERQPRAPGEPTHLSRRAEGRGACHLESLVYTATPRADCGRSPSAITTSAAKRAGSGGTARAVLHSLRSFPGRAPPHSTSAAASPILPGRPFTDRDQVDDPPCVLPRPTSRSSPIKAATNSVHARFRTSVAGANAAHALGRPCRGSYRGRSRNGYSPAVREARASTHHPIASVAALRLRAAPGSIRAEVVRDRAMPAARRVPKGRGRVIRLPPTFRARRRDPASWKKPRSRPCAGSSLSAKDLRHPAGSIRSASGRRVRSHSALPTSPGVWGRCKPR